MAFGLEVVIRYMGILFVRVHGKLDFLLYLKFFFNYLVIITVIIVLFVLSLFIGFSVFKFVTFDILYRLF